MNRKEIIKLAMDIDGHINDYPGGINLNWDTLVKIVQKAIKDEREACAKVCEENGKEPDDHKTYEGYDEGYQDGSNNCAAAIRSRCSQGSRGEND